MLEMEKSQTVLDLPYAAESYTADNNKKSMPRR